MQPGGPLSSRRVMGYGFYNEHNVVMKEVVTVGSVHVKCR
jgi:hypothetical protein